MTILVQNHIFQISILQILIFLIFLIKFLILWFFKFINSKKFKISKKMKNHQNFKIVPILRTTWRYDDNALICLMKYIKISFFFINQLEISIQIDHFHTFFQIFNYFLVGRKAVTATIKWSGDPACLPRGWLKIENSLKIFNFIWFAVIISWLI